MSLQDIINTAFENRDTITPSDSEVVAAVTEAIELIESGKARVAEPTLLR